MADSNQLKPTCALCYEVLTEPLASGLTQCCWQPICYYCERGLVEQPDDFRNSFTCLNCQASTMIVSRSPQQSLASFEQLVKKLYDEIAVTAQLRLNQLESQPAYLAQLEVDLSHNGRHYGYS